MTEKEQMDVLKVKTSEPVCEGVLSEGVGQSAAIAGGGDRGRPVNTAVPATDGQDGFHVLKMVDEGNCVRKKANSRWPRQRR